jgi:hypothetical protein
MGKQAESDGEENQWLTKNKGFACIMSGEYGSQSTTNINGRVYVRQETAAPPQSACQCHILHDGAIQKCGSKDR